jgi:uncharacterized protein (DUF58 family)
VGLTTFDTEIRLDMPARSSPRHFNEVMRQLESMKAGGETNVADMLHRLANRFKKRCLIVLISDLYDDPEAVVRALHHFRHRRHEVIVFHVLDKAEIEFPFKDVTSFYDLESKERIQVDPSYVREAYVQEMEAFIENYRRACAEGNIDYVLADTATPYDFMLTRYIAKRNKP